MRLNAFVMVWIDADDCVVTGTTGWILAVGDGSEGSGRSQLRPSPQPAVDQVGWGRLALVGCHLEARVGGSETVGIMVG